MADSENEAFFDAEPGEEPLHGNDLAASPGDGFASKPDKQTGLTPNEGTETPELVYVFGPSGSFFFNDHKQWQYAPTSRSNLQPWTSWNMEQAYIVALSADHGWCVAFKGHDGTVVWKFMRHERKCPHFGASRQQWKRDHADFIDLKAWLSANIKTESDAQQSSVTFGPGNSYYARSPKSSRWYNIPADLEQQIKVKTSQDYGYAPRLVALGKNGAWASIWPDGDCTWNLSKDRSIVQDRLRAHNTERVSYIALSPYDNDRHVVLFSSGEYIIRVGVSALKSIQPAVNEYAKALSRRKNITLYSTHVGKPVMMFSPDPVQQQQNEIQRLQQEVLELQAEASKTKVKPAHVAIGIGAIAVASGCIVM